MSTKNSAHIEKLTFYKPDNCIPLIEAANQGDIKLEALGRNGYPGSWIEDSKLGGIFNLGYWNASKKQNWGLDWHRNEGIEICYLASGTLPFQTESFQQTIRSGHMTITRPWQVHKVGDDYVPASHLYWLILDVGSKSSNKPWEWPDWLHLTAKDLDQLECFLRQNEMPVWQVSTPLKQCWVKIGKAIANTQEPHQESKIQILVSELLLELLIMLEHTKPKLDTYLSSSERAVELFLKRLGSENALLAQDWTIEQMADCCNLSESRFSDICHSLVNQSPIKYLNDLKIRYAQTLLLDSDELAITEIAFRCGFHSSQYFSTVFKSKAGLTPKAWKEEQKKAHT